MTDKCIIYRKYTDDDGNEIVQVQFPWHSAALDQFKQVVPYHARDYRLAEGYGWDQTPEFPKAWGFDPDYWEDVKDVVLSRFFPSYVIKEAE